MGLKKVLRRRGVTKRLPLPTRKAIVKRKVKGLLSRRR